MSFKLKYYYGHCSSIILEPGINVLENSLLDTAVIEGTPIKAGQEIQLSVPIKFIGESPGVKLGGVFQTLRSELDLSTLPKYLPNEIIIDISAMELGDTMHISDLKLEHITINHELDSSICSIVLPKKVEEPVDEEEEGEELDLEDEGAEPEVISSKAKDEDEEQKSSEG